MKKSEIQALHEKGYKLGLQLPSLVVEDVLKKLQGFKGNSKDAEKVKIYLKGLEKGIAERAKLLKIQRQQELENAKKQSRNRGKSQTRSR